MEQKINNNNNNNDNDNDNDNDIGISYKSNCMEVLILNKSTIKETLKYGFLMLIIGYSVCDIIDIKTNKKEPSKKSNIEFWVASSFTILSSVILICKIYSDIKNMKIKTNIRNNKSPFERMLQDYSEGRIDFSRDRERDKNNSLELSGQISEFDYSEL